MSENGAPTDPRRRTSIAMIVIGLLILVPSGLCTGFFSIASLVTLMGGARGETAGYAEGILMMALMIGAGPIALGAILLIVGLRRRR